MRPDDSDAASHLDPRFEKVKMLAREFYRSADPELVAETERAQRLVAQYNVPSGEATETRMALLRQLCGSGDGTVIRPPFACDYGYNIRLGRNAFMNFNCVLLDCAPIEIGNNLQMGPAVQVYTAAHPLEADMRRSGLEYARPIRIGHDVWIGGGAIILPGVTIGDNSVIGAGSVVAHDASVATVVARNPARIIRELSLLHREPERDVLVECRRAGLAFIPYFPLAIGLLTGKYRHGQPPPQGSRFQSQFGTEPFTDANLLLVEALLSFATSRGRTLIERAVSWLASRPTVASVIAGATSPNKCRPTPPPPGGSEPMQRLPRSTRSLRSRFRPPAHIKEIHHEDRIDRRHRVCWFGHFEGSLGSRP